MKEGTVKRKSWVAFVLGAVALYFLISLGIQFLVGIAGGLTFGIAAVEDVQIQSNIVNVALLISAVVLVLVFRSWLKNGNCLFTSCDGAKGFFKILEIAFLVWFTFLVIEYVIAVLGGEALNADEAVQTRAMALFQGNVLLRILAVGIATPIAEEMVFRAAVYGGLRQKFGVPASALIASLLFGLVHGERYLILVMTVFGIVLCLVYEKTCNLLYPIFMHIINNMLGGLMSLFPLFGNGIMAMILIADIMILCAILVKLGSKNENNDLRTAIAVSSTVEAESEQQAVAEAKIETSTETKSETEENSEPKTEE